MQVSDVLCDTLPGAPECGGHVPRLCGAHTRHGGCHIAGLLVPGHLPDAVRLHPGQECGPKILQLQHHSCLYHHSTVLLACIWLLPISSYQPLSEGKFAPAADMPRWWLWAYWLDPFSYAIQGLIANEFSAPRWSVPYNEFSSKRKSITLGQACLNVWSATLHFKCLLTRKNTEWLLSNTTGSARPNLTFRGGAVGR